MESTDSWGGACEVLRKKLQAALKEEVTLLETVQVLQSEKALLAADLSSLRVASEKAVSCCIDRHIAISDYCSPLYRNWFERTQ